MGIWLAVGFAALLATGLGTLLVDDRRRAARDAGFHHRISTLEREMLSVKKQVGWCDDKALTVRFAVPQPVRKNAETVTPPACPHARRG
jgi:hypothetical protein